MSPELILAAAINTAVEDCVVDGFNVQECGRQTKNIWALARAMGLEDSVSSILQAKCEMEMTKATERFK